MDWLDDPVDYNEDDDIEEVITITVEEFVRETPKSWEVRLNGFPEFFPKLQCTFDQARKKVTLPLWLAKKKNLVDADTTENLDDEIPF